MEQLLGFAPLIVVFGMMYFMMIRPQKKRDQEMRDMRSNLKVGDDIVTVGGVKGTITQLNEDTIIIASTDQKTAIEFTKSAILNVIPKDQGDGIEPKEYK